VAIVLIDKYPTVASQKENFEVFTAAFNLSKEIKCRVWVDPIFEFTELLLFWRKTYKLSARYFVEPFHKIKTFPFIFSLNFILHLI